MATLTEYAAESEWLGDDLYDAVEAPIDGIAHLRAFIRIENYLHVVTAFGQIVADGLLKEVRSFFNASLGGRIGVSAGGSSGGFVVNLTRAIGESTHSLGEHFAAQLQKLCMATMSRSFGCAGELVHPVLSCSDIAVNGRRFSGSDHLLRFDGEAPRPGATWAIGYHNDMTAAAGLLAELAEDRLCMRWQPIAPADDSGGFLFQEASICSVDLIHERVSRQAGIEAAERVGLGRMIDRWSVEQVLECLGTRPFAQLGVRISALSAVIDGWWSDILDYLGRNLDDAQRLTFIVSGATTFPTIGDAQVFIQRVRRLGCRIALDNFGVGFASLRHLVILSPDVVKIDCLFVHWAEQSDRSASILEHGIKLAGATGAAVVVNGISTERQRALAVHAGAQWMQGDLIAEARFGLSCASETNVRLPAAGQRHADYRHMHRGISL